MQLHRFIRVLPLLGLLALVGCSGPKTYFTCTEGFTLNKQLSPIYLTYRTSGEFYASGRTWIITETTDHSYLAEATWEYDPSFPFSRYDRLHFGRVGEEHQVQFSTSKLGRELLGEEGKYNQVEVYICKQSSRF